MSTPKQGLVRIPVRHRKMYVHSAIGIGIMVLFHLLPPIAQITPVGMRCVGAFLGMIYLWSTVGTLWPSLLGLLVIGMSGYAGEGPAAFNDMVLHAFGNNTVILVLFTMVLFGSLDTVGCTDYIAQWYLTRPMIKGRPYVFLFLYFMAAYALSALMTAVGALVMLWPIGQTMLSAASVKREDPIWPYFFVGMFFTASVGGAIFPFLGPQLIVLSTYTNITQDVVGYLPYILLNIGLTMALTILYLFIVKYVVRPDVSKLSHIDPSLMREKLNLPPMNARQWAFLAMVPVYVAMLLLPSFLPSSLPFMQGLLNLGTLGVTVGWIVVFSILWYGESPMLDFKLTAFKHFNWGVFFMIAAAVYGAGTLSADKTHVSTFLVEVLQPILGGRNEFFFVAIMLFVGLALTNVMTNAASAVILLPVLLPFAQSSGASTPALVASLTLITQAAILTPAASPHAGLLWGRIDLHSPREITSIGLPMCIASFAFSLFMIYPLAKILLG